jgi:hypothetical protein
MCDYMPREMRKQQEANSGKPMTRAQFTPDLTPLRHALGRATLAKGPPANPANLAPDRD